MRFVGLDYDFRDVDFVRRTLFNILLKYMPLALKVFRSPSGRGYHIKFFVDDNYSDNDLLNIRKEFSDDENRISVIDGRYRDVLFDLKCIDGKIMHSKELSLVDFLFFGKETEING
jgi:hypothetical protein